MQGVRILPMFTQWEVRPEAISLPACPPNTVRKFTEKTRHGFQVNQLSEPLDTRDLCFNSCLPSPPIGRAGHHTVPFHLCMASRKWGEVYKAYSGEVKIFPEKLSTWFREGGAFFLSPGNTTSFFFLKKIYIFYIFKIIKHITYFYEWNSSICILWLA